MGEESPRELIVRLKSEIDNLRIYAERNKLTPAEQAQLYLGLTGVNEKMEEVLNVLG